MWLLHLNSFYFFYRPLEKSIRPLYLGLQGPAWSGFSLLFTQFYFDIFSILLFCSSILRGHIFSRCTSLHLESPISRPQLPACPTRQMEPFLLFQIWLGRPSLQERLFLGNLWKDSTYSTHTYSLLFSVSSPFKGID